MATKLTGWILWALGIGSILWVLRKESFKWVAAYLFLSLAVFYLLHPQFWLSPGQFWVEMVGDFLSREEKVFVPSAFWGEIYGHRVPFYVPWGYLLFCVPPVVLGLSAFALFRAVECQGRKKGGPGSPCVFWIISALAPLGVATLPSVPSYDVCF